MVNKSLFSPPTPSMTHNAAGGQAYVLSPEQALAQFACTGTFAANASGSEEEQLNQVVSLADQVSDDYLARLAVYARSRGYMKDMPAALVLMLSRRNTELFHLVFPRVIDNGRMIRTFFTMLRSGRFGRKTFSYALRADFQRFFNQAPPVVLLNASIGNDPTLADILRMVRPRPWDAARRAMFAWLAGKPFGAAARSRKDKAGNVLPTPSHWAPAGHEHLPPEFLLLDAFRAASSEDDQLNVLDHLPHSVRWDLLSGVARGTKVWTQIALRMKNQALRMNLNTLLRHGVLADPEVTATLAERLADEQAVRRSRQFPYQFLAAYLNTEAGVPEIIRQGLCRAADAACGNVPTLGRILIGVDVSGSMSQNGVTGKGNSTVKCVQAAALVGAALLRQHPESVLVPFDTAAHATSFNRDDSILSIAARLSKFGGGGTDCSIPLMQANTALFTRKFDACVMVSDNESWVGPGHMQATGMMAQWDRFVANQRTLRQNGGYSPKLINIDLVAHGNSQADPGRPDVLNVGGFSDAVFRVMELFLDPNRRSTWVGEIKQTPLSVEVSADRGE